MIESAGLFAAPRIYSTVQVSLHKDGNSYTPECLYDEAAGYASQLNQAMREYSSVEYPEPNLMHYFDLYTNKDMEQRIKDKITSATPGVAAFGEKLYAVLQLEMLEDLTRAECDAFLENVRYQYEYGWGSEFELQNIPVDGNDTVCLRLFHSSVEFMRPSDLEGQLSQQAAPNTLLGLMQSGIRLHNVVLRGIGREPTDYPTITRCVNNPVRELGGAVLEKHDLSGWEDVLTATATSLTPGRHQMTLCCQCDERRLADFAEVLTGIEAQKKEQAQEQAGGISMHQPT